MLLNCLPSTECQQSPLGGCREILIQTEITGKETKGKKFYSGKMGMDQKLENKIFGNSMPKKLLSLMLGLMAWECLTQFLLVSF